MSDLFCAVCGEPWDTYHLRHDAPPWVYPLFMAGAGCESCEGEAPEGVDVDRIEYNHLRARVFDGVDDDPDPVGDVTSGRGVKWERPEDTLVWECEGCGIKRMHDIDHRTDEFDYFKKTKAQWRMYHWSDPDDEPEEFEGQVYCSKCLTWCDECGDKMLVESAVFDHENDPSCREPLHEDCYCTRRDDNHLEWVESEVQRVAYRFDGDLRDAEGLDLDAGNVACGVINALDWYADERQPDDEVIFNCLVENNWFSADEED